MQCCTSFADGDLANDLQPHYYPLIKESMCEAECYRLTAGFFTLLLIADGSLASESTPFIYLYVWQVSSYVSTGVLAATDYFIIYHENSQSDLSEKQSPSA